MVVTVYDVAQATGLSIASVSRALNARPGVSAATSARVMRTAADLGYRPNEVARSLVAKKTQTLALLVPDITNPFFPELVKGVQSVADESDQLLLLLDAPSEPDRLAQRLAALHRKQVDGVILVASELPAATGDVFDGMPGVFLDRAGSGGAPSVHVDQEHAAYLATRHVIQKGHSRIAHIQGPVNLTVSALRRSGWERACNEAGIASGDNRVFPGDFLEAGGHRAMERILDAADGTTAVFAANDLSAIGALACCASRGIRVPHDMSIIGFDGIELARYTSPALTTVAQPIRELGEQACALLLRRIAGEPADDIVLEASISHGGTVREWSGRADESSGGV
ncbi:LacI family DNA-binding transcriptional regulator [Microbacterium esteraromaticum]|uniref:LacI family DNA-binding transcriptional regulator n=1 Tax=Microbacterium esteraromaticum TaxID=57043 RepID=UPI001C93B0E8|nr:LacI family DNA-binding transcriptional regulator [Microbacterium esteraromaticum]MBY6061809.1 LacI family transcriptional regulator [Microbacterium esteraromaticum]